MTTNMTNGSLENKEISLKEQIENLSADLMYPSESDEKIEYFEIEHSIDEKLSLADFRMCNGIKPETVITKFLLMIFLNHSLKPKTGLVMMRKNGRRIV